MIKNLYRILDILPNDIELSEHQFLQKISKDKIIKQQTEEPIPIVEPLQTKDADADSSEVKIEGERSDDI